MKNNIRTLSSGKFILLGVLFSIVFWFVDGLIDTLFFSHASYWESLNPDGMELYMRLLLCLAIIGFGFLASRYVEANNQLNRYIALSLQEDSTRYKAIYESTPFSIVVVNQDLMIIDWNPEAEKSFGWKAHEALGKDFYKLLFPEDTQPKSPSIAQLIQAGYLVAPNMTKSGQFVNYSWTHIGVRDWEDRTNSVLLIGQKYLNIDGL